MFVLSWVLLLPIYAANSGGIKVGLDRFTFGNVGLDATPRYAAPLVVAYVFTCKPLSVPHQSEAINFLIPFAALFFRNSLRPVLNSLRDVNFYCQTSRLLNI